ncbi:MAG: hypothetical protein GXO25_02220 [Euryarchaeota archaeon]|nr:hypothetical protein [Euryarchaeota archaeon]
MQYSMASKCMYNRGGKCYFLISEPQPCQLCVNFASADPSLLKELKIKKSIATYYDLIMSDPRYRAMFPRSDNEMQLSLNSRAYELPDDED